MACVFSHRAGRLLPLYWLFLAMNLALVPALGAPWPNLLRYATLTQNLITPHPILRRSVGGAAGGLVRGIATLLCRPLQSAHHYADCCG